MASIVSAGTTSATALNMSADTSGVLQLASNNGTVAVTVDTAQKTTINNLSAVAYTPATSLLTSGTTQASTSGTSIDFTGIPSWVKRVTVMFNGVSTNGTSNYQVQIGSGSVSTSGYNAMSARAGTSFTGVATVATTGFIAVINAATDTLNGNMVITLQSANTWTQSSGFYLAGTQNLVWGGGISPALSGTLDRVRLTTVNGTDTFDAGSINILYE